MLTSPPLRGPLGLAAAVGAMLAALAFTTPAALAATRPSCASKVATNGGQTATRPGALKVLVPQGADSVLVCRYAPTNRGFAVTRAGLASGAAAVAKLTAGLDAIQAGRHVICPDYELLGGETVTFYYPAGPRVVLTINLGGCLQISNGHVTRPGLNTPALAQLEALLRPVKSAAS